MRLRSLALPLLFSLSTASFAFADTVPYTFFGDGVSGSLTLTETADPTTPNALDVSSVAGTVTIGSNVFTVTSTPAGSFNPNSLSYIALFPASGGGTDGYDYDNLFYTAGAPFDTGGLVFELSDGEYVNLDVIGGTEYFENTDFYEQTLFTTNGIPINVPAAPTPEPTSLILLGTGICGIAGVARRRFRG